MGDAIQKATGRLARKRQELQDPRTEQVRAGDATGAFGRRMEAVSDPVRRTVGRVAGPRRELQRVKQTRAARRFNEAAGCYPRKPLPIGAGQRPGLTLQ